MKQKIYKYSLLLFIVFATSCANTRYLSLDVMKPAGITFPKNIVNVTIVDNAGMVVTDSVAEGNKLNIETTLKGKTKDVFVESFTQFLTEENFFYGVNLYPKALRENFRYDSQGMLRSSSIQDIAKETDADAVISIDLVNSSYEKTMATVGHGIYFNGITGNIDLIIRIYDMHGRNLMKSVIYQDSIFVSASPKEILTFGLYKDLALQASEKVVNSLVPHWEQQERYCYTDGTKLMKQADKYAKENKWVDAAKTWGEAYEAVDNDRQKAKIAANIALANEYLDDVDNAVTWIRIASGQISSYERSDEYSYINWYKLKLLERQQGKEKLLEQIGVEKNEPNEGQKPDETEIEQ